MASGSINLNINANAAAAKKELSDLQSQLQQISNMKINVGTSGITADIEKASQAAMKLQTHLAQAMNPQTGNLDFTKFYSSIQKSGTSLQQYGEALQNMGPAGQKAFVSLANSIAKSEIPLKRSSQLVDKMWDGFKRTAGWQLQSSIIHGFIGHIQSAMGYAKDLNKSLTDIRIVTGQSGEQMANFAKQANQAAKSLNTTTTNYTKASLIYYQQGLSDQEVKARTETTIKMANVTGESAQKVSDQMTAIWNNYDDGTKSLTHYADVMTALGAATASSTSEIAEGLQKFASISNTVGLSYEYAASALATVTATSRESADVVGNSFKTLFSRIQGLQLGETLEDGTTLNKYSTALAKVGISIKDSSGEMKQMDSILDEMGTKWQTLANDEKMALAQTVAGVRQYTQLMTLMENWDYFKQNLNVANTSQGTIDTQAAIYAESWEAASNRVRASWEGLWDNLINSDSFITMLDGLSGFINILDQMVTGLGGASGAFLTFGGVLTKVFNKQISEGISNMAYGIKMMMPGQYQTMVNERNLMISQARETIESDYFSTGRETESAAIKKTMSDSLTSSLIYGQNKHKMSMDQLIIDEMYKNSINQLQEDLIKAGQEKDAAKKIRQDFNDKFVDKVVGGQSLLSKDINQSRKELTDRQEQIRQNLSKKYYGDTEQMLSEEDILRKNLNLNNFSSKDQKSMKRAMQEYRDLQTRLTAFNTMGRKVLGEGNTSFFGSENDFISAQQRSIDAEIAKLQSAQENILKRYKGGEKSLNKTTTSQSKIEDQRRYQSNKEQIANLQSQRNNIQIPLRATTLGEAAMNQGNAVAQLQTTVNSLKNLTSLSTSDAQTFIDGLVKFSYTASDNMQSSEFMRQATAMANAFKASGGTGLAQFQDDFRALMSGSSFENFVNQSFNQMATGMWDMYKKDQTFAEGVGKGKNYEYFAEGLKNAYLNPAQADEKFSGILKMYESRVNARNDNLAKTEQIGNVAQGIVSGAQGLMQAAAAGESLKSLSNQIEQGTMTFSSALTGITSLMMQSAMGFQGMFSALSMIPALGAGAAGGISLLVTGLLLLSSTIADFVDKSQINNEEMMVMLATSANELQSTADTTKEASEIAKKNNEDYLNGVKKIKSFSQDPFTLAEDVLESNRKALALIQDYNLEPNKDYITSTNGLIDIKESSLKTGLQEKENIATYADYANILGQAVIDIKQATIGKGSAEEQMSDILKNSGLISWEELPEIIEAWKSGNEAWESFVNSQNSNRQSEFRAFEEAFKNIDQSQRDLEQREIMADNAALVIASKIISDSGVTPEEKNYNAYQHAVAEDIRNQMSEAAGSFINTSGNVLTEEVKAQLPNLIKDMFQQEGAIDFQLQEGFITYQLEGESKRRKVAAESINSYYAASKIDAEAAIARAEGIQKEVKKFGLGAEAAFNLKEFGTLQGSSIDSIIALGDYFNEMTKSGEEDRQKARQEKREIGYDSEDAALYNQAKRLSEDFAAAGMGDIYSQMSGSAVEQLNNLFGENGSMQNINKKATLESFGEMVPLLEEAGLAGDDLAAALSAIANLDFQDSTIKNLEAIVAILNAITGGSFQIGDLPGIEDILNNLGGNSAANLNEVNDSLVTTQKLLGQLKQYDTVDEATANALRDRGIISSKNEEGNYVITSSDEDIARAKKSNWLQFSKDQAQIDAAQKAYAESGLDFTGEFNSRNALFKALGATTTEDGKYIDFGELDSSKVEALQKAIPNLNLETLFNTDDINVIDALLNTINSFIQNGTTTEGEQSSKVSGMTENITSAQEMWDAINTTKDIGGAGFLDENGIMTSEAWERFQTFAPTSQRVAAAMEAQKIAMANYLPVADEYAKAVQNQQQAEEEYNKLKERAENGENIDPYDLEAAQTKAEEAQMAVDAIEEGAIVQETSEYLELQQAIDATAAARGIDAEAIAMQVEAIGGKLKQAGVDAAGIVEVAADMVEAKEALDNLNKSADTYKDLVNKIVKQGPLTDPKDLQNLETMAKLFNKIAGAEDLMIQDTAKLSSEFQKFLRKNPEAIQDFLKGSGKALKQWQAQATQIKADELFGTNYAETAGDALDQFGEQMAKYSDQLDSMEIGQSLNEAFGQGSAATQDLSKATEAAVEALTQSAGDVGKAMDLLAEGSDIKLVPVDAVGEANIAVPIHTQEQESYEDGNGAVDIKTISDENKESLASAASDYKFYKIVKTGGSGGSPSGGGGGGGGGSKPKKVANKRKSQVVTRYKRNDHKRDNAQKAKKSIEKKADYLYGESKIAQMKKINKLAEKEAKITADRISESRKYLEEDRQNLIKYMQKYGFEAEFETDGFLANYEEAWTKVYEEIAALYEDNELTDEEKEIEEELNVKLEELEGALEDYENSLKELANDIESYEESLYEMYDSKLEQLEHRLEFRLELNEDDMSYIDFLLEALGDNASKAVDRISLITQKSTALFDNIVRVKENIQAIYDLSDNPFQMWATGGLDIDGLLTEAQVEQLREHRDQLMDYMKELLEMRETIQEEVLNVFDAWTEKIDHNISAIDHYTNVLEYFKNVIDITGKDVFGMSDSFIRSMESAAIDQSMDSIEANKAYYESLVQANAEAEQALQEARARGDAKSEEHWEEVVRSTSESMQSAQDALLSALETTLTMISDQFTAAMEDAVEQFNESIYASGGLEGLSNDYSLLREQADLMAEDYDKIYNLTKLTRNINKTLDDTNIIAGKQRLTKLLQEVNDLQKSGVELSKYDLEYLEAKYNLYLAQIELENAQGNKDTVQLSRDSEGNWSYIYTTNEEKVNEAQQKYEDALYEMQNMNHEYMEEMSSSMINTASQMSEEIANLQISDFANLEEYNNKVQEIREKYEKSLNLQNEELNKVIDNNESLYETDWQNYSKYTGYKISADKDWIDSFAETTLGHLMNSESVQSDFNQTIIGLTDTLAQGLSDAAVQYFTQMDTALQAYGSSIDGFSGHIVSMTNTVKTQSDEAAKATESMGKRMEDAFSDVVAAVKEWQEIEAPKIEEELEDIKTLIEEINESIRTSAELTTDKDTSIIGSSKAIELINESGLFGSWKLNERGDIDVSDGTGTETTNFVDYNAKLLEELDDAIELHANGRISDDALAEMFKRYWAYKDIINRIYDTTNTDAEKELEEKEKEIEKKLGGSIKFDTGGYTGEWGNEGKIAMLHEKELVLNANDTSNFLEALNISRQLIEMIELNARASSLGLGEMVASTIKETTQTVEQQVSITAEFPNATDHSEIEEAFDNLINIASQYAYRS